MLKPNPVPQNGQNNHQISRVDNKLSLLRESYYYRGSKLYIKVPDQLKEIRNQTSFKKAAKKWVQANIPVLPP